MEFPDILKGLLDNVKYKIGAFSKRKEKEDYTIF